MIKRPDDEAAFRAYCDSVLGPMDSVFKLEGWRDQLRESVTACKLRIIQNEFDADRIDEYLAELKKAK